jgi:hypothetical protein
MRPLLALWFAFFPAPLSAKLLADWDGKAGSRNWTSFTLKALEDHGKDLLALKRPKDAPRYCPRFAKLTRSEKKAFYVQLLSSMARLESGFDPKTRFTEKFKDAKGERVVSRGLLQMSRESAKGYGCGITSERDLHRPAANIRCAVRALNRWVAHDQVIGTKKRGGARYWAVLRDPKAEKIAAKTRALPFCRG